MENQMSIFEVLYPTYKIVKPIRLIEFFVVRFECGIIQIDASIFYAKASWAENRVPMFMRFCSWIFNTFFNAFKSSFMAPSSVIIFSEPVIIAIIASVRSLDMQRYFICAFWTFFTFLFFYSFY